MLQPGISLASGLVWSSRSALCRLLCQATLGPRTLLLKCAAFSQGLACARSWTRTSWCEAKVLLLLGLGVIAAVLRAVWTKQLFESLC